MSGVIIGIVELFGWLCLGGAVLAVLAELGDALIARREKGGQ